MNSISVIAIVISVIAITGIILATTMVKREQFLEIPLIGGKVGGCPKGTFLTDDIVKAPRTYGGAYRGQWLHSNGPGSVALSLSKPSAEIKCPDKVPDFDPEGFYTLGSGRTMITRENAGGCLSNVNGINKPVFKNPYGSMEDGQAYGYCVKGIDNAFSEN